jgi:hypothetical protein
MVMVEEDVSDSEGRDWAWGADTVVTQCLLCKHTAKGPQPVCAAFPGSIPPKILSNDFDHRRPWIDPATGEPGDRGVPDKASILFEPEDGINSRSLAALYRHLDATNE